MQTGPRQYFKKISALVCLLPMCMCESVFAENQPVPGITSPYITDQGKPLKQSVTDFLPGESTSFSPIVKTLYVNTGLFLGNDVSIDWRYSKKHKVELKSKYKIFNTGDSTHLFDANYQWKIALKHDINFQVWSDRSKLGKRKSRYQIIHQMRPTAGQTISVRSQYNGTQSGASTSLYSTSYDFKLNIPHVSSNLLMHYEISPDVNTKIGSTFHVYKRVDIPAGIPVNLSGNLKWRKHEFSDGSEVSAVGAKITAAFSLAPNWKVDVNHVVGDRISPEFTSVASSYKTRFNGKNVEIKFKAKSDNTVLIKLESIL